MARSSSSTSLSATDPTEAAKIVAPAGSGGGMTVPLPMLDALPPIEPPAPPPAPVVAKAKPAGPPPEPEARKHYRVAAMNAKGKVNLGGMSHRWTVGRVLDSQQYPESAIKSIKDQGVTLEEFTK